MKNQKKYNGCDGKIIGPMNTRGRYTILLLEDNICISVKPSNLTNVPGHHKLEGWDNRPIQNESEEDKDKCLKKFM